MWGFAAERGAWTLPGLLAAHEEGQAKRCCPDPPLRGWKGAHELQDLPRAWAMHRDMFSLFSKDLLERALK